jgi:hypothetical protein
MMIVPMAERALSPASFPAVMVIRMVLPEMSAVRAYGLLRHKISREKPNKLVGNR